MKDELFTELVSNVREGGSILRCEKELLRIFNLAQWEFKRICKKPKLYWTQPVYSIFKIMRAL